MTVLNLARRLYVNSKSSKMMRPKRLTFDVEFDEIRDPVALETVPIEHS